VSTDEASAAASDDAITLETDGRKGKRGSDRKEMQTTIRVAPYDGENLPSGGDFQLVQARDISPSGVAFYLPENPDSDFYIVLLGTAEKPILVKAQVARFQNGYFERKRQFLVGCQMVGKLN